jgi:3-oxoacyl-[acyl-carrier-protein] synthase II
MAERVVVVGHGAATCLGRDLDSTWAGLVAGRSGIKRHEALGPDRFQQGIGGMVEGVGPGAADEDPAVAKLPAKSIHLALAAAREAWAGAGLPDGADLDRDRVAIVVSSAMGGLDLYDAESARMAGRKSLAASPYLIPGLVPNMPAGQIAQHLGLYGPSFAPANACATGGHAVALGALLLRAGEADVAVCGAAESVFTPPVVNGFATMRALFTRKGEDRGWLDPAQASRPFSVDRAGFILAEGAGMLVLATESAARRFGLRPLAELLGAAVNSDGYHVAMPNPERVRKCLALALERAGVAPGDIDYYNAHGTSTTVNDEVETGAIKAVFGAHAKRLPVSSLKGAIGHSLGAASAIEAAVCVRALREQTIPPTINYRADPELDLDYVPEGARPARLGTVLSASFGFGGTNNALVFRRWDDGGF